MMRNKPEEIISHVSENGGTVTLSLVNGVVSVVASWPFDLLTDEWTNLSLEISAEELLDAFERPQRPTDFQSSLTCEKVDTGVLLRLRGWNANGPATLELVLDVFEFSDFRDAAVARLRTRR